MNAFYRGLCNFGAIVSALFAFEGMEMVRDGATIDPISIAAALLFCWMMLWLREELNG